MVLRDAYLNTIFKKLESCGLGAIQDPKGISGLVKACTAANKSDALSRVATASTRAKKARQKEQEGKTSEAFEWWDRLFNGKFPSFYY